MSDIDTAVVDSLTCLTPTGRLEKRTWRPTLSMSVVGGHLRPWCRPSGSWHGYSAVCRSPAQRQRPPSGLPHGNAFACTSPLRGRAQTNRERGGGPEPVTRRHRKPPKPSVLRALLPYRAGHGPFHERPSLCDPKRGAIREGHAAAAMQLCPRRDTPECTSIGLYPASSNIHAHSAATPLAFYKRIDHASPSSCFAGCPSSAAGSIAADRQSPSTSH